MGYLQSWRKEGLKKYEPPIEKTRKVYYDKAERTVGITKKEQTGFSIQKAVMGYRTANLICIDLDKHGAQAFNTLWSEHANEPVKISIQSFQSLKSKNE